MAENEALNKNLIYTQRDLFIFEPIYNGEMSERFNVPDSKSGVL